MMGVTTAKHMDTVDTIHSIYVDDLNEEEQEAESVLSDKINVLGAKAIRVISDQIPVETGVSRYKKVYVMSILIFACFTVMDIYRMKKKPLCANLFILCLLLIFMPAAFGDMHALTYLFNKLHLVFFQPFVNIPMSIVNQKIDVLSDTIYDTLVSDLNDDMNINPYTLFEVMVDKDVK